MFKSQSKTEQARAAFAEGLEKAQDHAATAADKATEFQGRAQDAADVARGGVPRRPGSRPRTLPRRRATRRTTSRSMRRPRSSPPRTPSSTRCSPRWPRPSRRWPLAPSPPRVPPPRPRTMRRMPTRSSGESAAKKKGRGKWVLLSVRSPRSGGRGIPQEHGEAGPVGHGDALRPCRARAPGAGAIGGQPADAAKEKAAAAASAARTRWRTSRTRRTTRRTTARTPQRTRPTRSRRGRRDHRRGRRRLDQRPDWAEDKADEKGSHRPAKGPVTPVVTGPFACAVCGEDLRGSWPGRRGCRCARPRSGGGSRWRCRSCRPADALARRDRLADADGAAREVVVGRAAGDAVDGAVVDHDAVAVAATPAGLDDLACRGRGDVGPAADGEVVTGVHAVVP